MTRWLRTCRRCATFAPRPMLPRSRLAISSPTALVSRTRSRSAGSIRPTTRSRPRHVPRRLALETLQAPFPAGSEVELLEPRDARARSSHDDSQRLAVHGSGATGGARSSRVWTRRDSHTPPRCGLDRRPATTRGGAPCDSCSTMGDRRTGRGVGSPLNLSSSTGRPTEDWSDPSTTRPDSCGCT